MPILYTVVSRETTILAKFASCAGNFSQVTEQILEKISPDLPKLTYSHGSYLFHYILEDGIIFLCITDDEFPRAKAFHFLTEIKRRFQVSYGTYAQTALPYAMNSEFSRVLANQMKYYSENKATDQIEQLQGELDDLKDIMVKNIDSVANRGEHLELLINKTENLSATSVTFRKSSRGLARSLWWKNMKLTIIVIVVVILIIYFIISAACGGLSWPSCV